MTAGTMMNLPFPQPAPQLLPASVGGEILPASRERWPALDGLRGLALLAVMGVHTNPTVLPGGFLGVDLFFVLSGFLITCLLVREWQKFGSIRLRQFYLRRALRLCPALWAMLLVLGLATLTFGTRHDLDLLRRTLPSVLLYIFNWRMANPACLAVHKSLLHLWSLAIEDQFYLVWPILLAGLLALRVRRRWVLAFVLAAVLAPALLRAGHEPSPGAPNSVRIAMRLYFGTDARADSLFAGCFVGLLAGWRLGPKARWALTALRWAAWPAAAVVLFHFLACMQLDIATKMHQYLYFRGGFTVVAVSVAVLIAALVWSPPPRMARFLEAPILRWVGAVSYGAYLWNLPIYMALLTMHWSLPIARNINPLTWAGSLAAGALSYYYLETPFLRLKHRWERRQITPLAADAVSVAAAA
jgi:peptidoglycan/LPS O-acetylase OafA/YrhL